MNFFLVDYNTLEYVIDLQMFFIGANDLKLYLNT